jgi:chemotaxis protein methyltransferase CheR
MLMDTIGDPEYQFICQLVHHHSGIYLGPDKKELVTMRVAKRLRHLGIPDYESYCEMLRTTMNKREIPELLDVISTNFTNFFREMKHFEFLKKSVLTPFATQLNGTKKEFSVWSAACSSGEEAYSIAVFLAENFANYPQCDWHVEASDISTRMLLKAERGVYAAKRVELPKSGWLRKYFQIGVNQWAGYYRVKKEIRSRVHFHHLNLLQAEFPFSSKFQVIFCRNVLIYFDRDTQRDLILKLANYLLPGGYLLVGHSESLTGIQHNLQVVRPSIYQKPLK